MKGRQSVWTVVGILVILSMVACAAATPEIITVEKEVPVEKKVVETVVVEKEVVVEKKVVETVIVEKEVIVTVAPTKAPEKVHLTMWKAPHSDQDEKFWTETLAKFTEANPSIEVEYRVTPWGTFHEQYTAAYAGDSPPDVAYFPNTFFPKYAAAGQQVVLDDLPFADLGKWKALHDEAIWDLGSYDGKQYGLPFLQIGISFVWNKDAFEAAGLDGDTPPATWEELVEYAKKLTIDESGKNAGEEGFNPKKVVQWGYSIMDNTTGEMVNFVPVPIRNYGGEFLNEDGTKWIMNDAAAVEGLQIQVDLINTYHVAPPFGTYVGHDIDKAFADGKVAMQLSYSNFILAFRDDIDFEVGIGMPPCGPDNCESLGGIGYWNMAEKAKDKEAVWKLMEFLSSQEVVEEYTAMTKLFPCRTDVHPFAGDALMEGFATTQKGYMRNPNLPFDYWSIMMSESEAALVGMKSAQEALDAAAERINELLEEQ